MTKLTNTFMVYGLGFRVQSVGAATSGVAPVGVNASKHAILNTGLKVQGSEFRVQG